MIDALHGLRDLAAEADFSGVVRIEHGGQVCEQFACGFADRANQRPNKLSTRFAIASGTKGLTALTIMSLVESGDLLLSTTARSILGDRLPLVDDRVTIDHLLTHRSGVGDFLDEDLLDDIDDHVLGDRSSHCFETPLDYLDLLSSHPQVSTPGEQFRYNNGGYVLLSIIIELTTGSFAATVHERVLAPAQMRGGGLLRSDDLPVDTALGYLRNGRSNVFHLPVIAVGDGGAYVNLDDMSALWDNLLIGKIVSTPTAEMMMAAESIYNEHRSYGRGFWIGDGGDHVWLEGMDAGVSFQAGIYRSSGYRYTIISNNSSGAWPLVKTVTQPEHRS